MVGSHYPTPIKAKLIGTIGFLQHHKLDYFKSDVFRFFSVTHPRSREILKQQRNHRHLEIETRSRKRLLSANNLQTMEKIL